ncbi:hypothetical protein [Kutzneria sp. 744]|uniref:hypothetical protein n=1 Tax=Kutzneria sp. (strain 744) TaxID=345341 RepID=UPI0003EEBD18|nr:hypothetical protein [Kutzneria sp. 744]EWM13626.1 hypothetical protein KUTG_03930 [Kutzneria sp. 744]
MWATWTVLDTDHWVQTAAPLPKDPQVATAIASYATDEVFQALDVPRRLSEVLPSQAAFIRSPVSCTTSCGASSTSWREPTSSRPCGSRPTGWSTSRPSTCWWTSQVAVAQGDEIRIDLLPIVNQVLRHLSQRLPTLFGHQLNLPEVTGGEIPQNLRARIGDALGVTLPANFAQFTV